MELWDGTRVPATENAHFTLFINEPFALRAAFAPPLDLSPGRAFVEKWIDIDGDIELVIDAIENALEILPRLTLPRLIAQLMRLPNVPRASRHEAQLHGKRHSKQRDAAAIGFHYDQPIEFYRSFLDSRMVYSCGYWDEGVQTLDDAQVAKIDHTLRKLRVRPGERLLDIGCGWGALVLRAAQQFGAEALGVTLSRLQYEEAQRRIAQAGVGDRVRVELRDYRDLRGETFHKIVSVGMIEHVGRERLQVYFHTAFDALRKGGLFLNHGIAQQSRDGRGCRASGFMDRYVFPDGDLVSIETILRAAGRVGFEVRDVENLREHYARTLRAWHKNLEASCDNVIAATDERTYRIWKIYMAGSARNFWRCTSYYVI
ncbi:cyclopropane-fatty-acyl-phospholipid synthase [Vulcanimicrobium alpinum]|uniref:Cyclopropane-fatty-acyl-phospholipid synthase n=1 Tax=Vulcanimicrobium alpinum TaxID=3016050 RepID=A0AAN1XZK8_UNVUL|nr:cyclopropane-fatty-acyl-phospholipid synthase family protein [Vulcanimicrobium alpinum]BDE08255.1 cyclopropane-fatty-acyl-phospholipid synthase [Vulcanimicrobium alpinum]